MSTIKDDETLRLHTASAASSAAGASRDKARGHHLSIARGSQKGFSFLLNQIKRFFLYHITCQGNTGAYLRRLGARVGSDCYILTTAFGSEPWLVEIGNRVILARGVTFVTHDGASRLFRAEIPGSSPFGNCYGTIRIRDNCFVGMNSVVLPNVEIGPRSIVGSGSIVSRDVPPNTVVAGVPATQISTWAEYIENYKRKMISIKARNRKELRRELTLKLWGEVR